MSKLNRPSFKIILYTYKKLQNGDHPVMVRVTFQRKQKYYSLQVSASPENWNSELSRIQRPGKRLSDKEKDSNIILDRFNAKLAKAEKHFDEVEFTFNRFEEYLFPPSKNSSFFLFAQSVIDELMAEGRAGTALSYRDALTRLKAFRKQKDLSFRDIDRSLLDDFKKHLRPTNSINSIGIYFRTLKAIYNRALAKNLVKEDLSPWKGYKIETQSTRKRALTKNHFRGSRQVIRRWREASLCRRYKILG